MENWLPFSQVVAQLSSSATVPPPFSRYLYLSVLFIFFPPEEVAVAPEVVFPRYRTAVQPMSFTFM